VTVKLEVKIPEGASKIDLGPTLEPILARLLYLERKSGHDDVDPHEGGVPTVKGRGPIPVHPDRVEGYHDWLLGEWDTILRMVRLRPETLSAYFRQTEGWKRAPRGDKDFYERETRFEAWEYETVCKCCYCKVPYAAKPDEWLYFLKDILREIRETIRDAELLRLSPAQILDRVEACAPPLIQLAEAAED
jgi:hypothetical protein